MTTKIDTKISLRDMIYIISMIVGLTLTVSKLDAMTSVNETAVKSMQRILDNHETRISTMEFDVAKSRAYEQGIKDAQMRRGG